MQIEINDGDERGKREVVSRMSLIWATQSMHPKGGTVKLVAVVLRFAVALKKMMLNDDWEEHLRAA